MAITFGAMSVSSPFPVYNGPFEEIILIDVKKDSRSYGMTILKS